MNDSIPAPVPANVIAIANCKGGVAKTTTTANLGAALAGRGRRVLLIDLDAQQDLCAALGAKIPRPGIADVLLSTAFFETGDLAESFVRVHGLTVAGGYGIDHMERELGSKGCWEKTLASALAPHRTSFDYVLLDCAPTINCLTTNALAAAEDVIVPVQTEFLAAHQLSSIMSAVDDVRSRLNASVRIRGFLPTMYDSRNNHALEIMEQIALQAHMWGVRAFQPIPRAVRLAEASQAGQPIRVYAEDSRANDAYERLADELDHRRRVRTTVATASTSLSRSMTRSMTTSGVVVRTVRGHA